jgi:hypothetical protein
VAEERGELNAYGVFGAEQSMDGAAATDIYQLVHQGISGALDVSNQQGRLAK